jgi:RimJ/RimL family protein N-acetyltransferase
MNKTRLTTTIIIGEHIQLEPLRGEHAEPLRHIANDEKIWAYMPSKAFGIFFDGWFEECMQQHADQTKLTYVVRRLSDNLIIGSRAYYEISHQHQRLEIGYGWFTPSVWGTTYNHESLFLLFKNAFEQWKFNRIQIGTDPCNKRSYNTLKKLGAAEEGLIRQHMIHHNGLITDTVMFSILASEWPAVKTKLWTRLNQY